MRLVLITAERLKVFEGRQLLADFERPIYPPKIHPEPLSAGQVEQLRRQRRF